MTDLDVKNLNIHIPRHFGVVMAIIYRALT
jgi:hypothetical protein